MSQRNSGQLWLIALSAIMAQPALAQQTAAAARDYPSKPIRFVVPFAPGGGASIVAQIVAQKLSSSLGQNILMDNRGGAGGLIGINVAAKSEPDGYTVLFMSGAYTSIPSLHKKLPYDPVRDLMPITLIGTNFGQVFAANPSLPVRSIKELIVLAKANPGKIDYGSAGIGSTLHFAGELFNMLANVKLNHVPYKGGEDATRDAISGQIHLTLPAAHSIFPYIQSRRLRALAITAENRWSRLPNVPTMEESGVKGYKFINWYGLWFPARTPVEYVDRIQRVIAKLMKDPEMKQRFGEKGLNVVGSTPAQFEKVIQEDLARYQKIIADIGLVPE